MAYNVNTGGSLAPTSATPWALGQAQNNLVARPGYTQPNLKSPAQTPYYTPADSPAYQGLMGSDYNALQASLQQPGEQAINQTFDRTAAEQRDVWGGGGLYGSSIQQQGIGDLGAERARELGINASTAAANRYAMQAGDLGQQNAWNLAQQGIGNEYNQGEMMWNQGQSQQAIDFANQQALMKQSGNDAAQQQQFANLMAMATGSMPATQSSMAAQAQAASDKPNWLDYVSAGAGAANALFGADEGGSSVWDSLANSGIGKTVSSWWSGI